MGEVYLTKKGYQKLYEDLEYLKKVKRREISRAIGLAREHGDLGENAEYDAAKDAQAHTERRIAELEEKLSGARIIEDEDLPSDQVLIGATVKLKDLDAQEEFEYMLVSAEEADFEQNKISVSSPIGQGLMGRKAGETVAIKVPRGTLNYKILAISRE